MADARDVPRPAPANSGTLLPEMVSNDRNSSEIVASDGTVEVCVTNDLPGGSLASASMEDDRKKRCVDRYDSSESSDSGVAVLSGTESGGCSGSEFTEPGSPASPASSDSGVGIARPPPWSLRSPVAAAVAPAPARTHHQGTITSYFNHKMKTPNPLKRDHSWSRADEPHKKFKSATDSVKNIEDYICLLKDTLKPKILPEAPKKRAKKPKSSGIDELMKEGITSNPYPKPASARPRIVPVYTEQVDGDGNGCGITYLHTGGDARVNGATYGSNNLYLNSACKKPAAKKRLDSNKKGKPKEKELAPASGGTTPPAVRKTTWYRLESGVSLSSNIKQTPREQAITTALAALPGEKGGNGLRTIPIGFNGLQQLPTCSAINIAPHCSSAVVTSAALSPFISVPQVMLTALRIPQNTSQPTIGPPNGINGMTGLNASNGLNGMNGIAGLSTTNAISVNGINGLNGINSMNGLNGYNRQNVSITSPTKLNGGFVFPLVQNINGTVVQIPNLMTKAGHNYVLPHSTQIQAQMQPQRTDNMHHQGQMLINGTILKLTSSIAPTYSAVVTKPTTTANISYPVVNKAINTALPTVMTPKLHYMNVGHHSVLMPQPGYFINPVPNNASKENFVNIAAQNHLTHIGTSCSFSTTQPSPAVQSVSPCNQMTHTSSIPIPPVKPPDKDKGTVDAPTLSPVRMPALSPVRAPSVPPASLPAISPANLINPIISSEQKKLNSLNYPNLTKLLNRPFAQVSKSTEKLLDIAPTIEDRLEKESLELVEEVPKVDISPADTTGSDDTLFTQITVMEQVSSNVQNTILETTFSCVTNESSESGIGTDKSLDSPSDSRTSKDCDDDSSLSLSVSVCSMEVEPCQKSPILKQPKILRFPPMSAEQKLSEQRPKGRRRPSSVTTCRWENCRDNFDTDTDLLEHLQTAHVNGQAGRENYVCLWTGCKVRGKPSCSRLWLERHALSHGGNKPFKCIVDDCDRRFSTQMLLERHVNNHFDDQSSGVNSAKKAADSGPRLIRRNGKVLRYRRQPWSARMFDFFDGGMMEGLAWRLMRVSCWRTRTTRFTHMPPAHELTLVAALAGTRYNATTNTREALVTYSPPHVIDDEWIPEEQVRRTRSVNMATLPAHTKVMLYEQLCESYVAPAAPPPAPPAAPPAAATSESSRMLNELIAKQRQPGAPHLNGFRSASGDAEAEARLSEPRRPEVSGAAKRKQGRRHGGNAFWPCGR